MSNSRHILTFSVKLYIVTKINSQYKGDSETPYTPEEMECLKEMRGLINEIEYINENSNTVDADDRKLNAADNLKSIWESVRKVFKDVKELNDARETLILANYALLSLAPHLESFLMNIQM
ncbi:MAG: hypothetical protein FWD97_02705 [Defluviitaleaceae bacterium]|nr:hypothetical protein [Defluviitaleaceae bacterium]